MTGNTRSYIDYVADRLSPLRELSQGRFFGGIGLRHQGRLFAMVMGDTLYFAVDEPLRQRYRDMGSQCFSYTTRKGRVSVEKYYAVPEHIMDDDEELLLLARASIALAR